MQRFFQFTFGLLFAATVFAQVATALTPALVEQRLNSLRESGSADDSEIVTAYAGVREFLDQAESYSREAANLLQTVTTAPQREAEIQARIDLMGEAQKNDEPLDALSSEDLETQVRQARAELDELKNTLAALDRRLAARETNADAMRARMGEITTSIDSLPAGSGSVNLVAQPTLAEAQQWLGLAEALSLRAERRALEAGLSSQPVRYSAMALERAEVNLNAERLANQVRAFEGQLQGRVAQVVDAQSLGIQPEDPVFVLAGHMVAGDSDLRAERIAVNDKLAGLRSQIEEIDLQYRALTDRFATARRIVDFAADSDVLGGVLLAYWQEAAQFQLADPTANLSRRAGSSVIHRIELEEELRQLSSATGYINRQLEEEGIAADVISQQNFSALVELVSAYRGRLRAVIGSESDYIASLSKLGERYQALMLLVDDYESYLKSRILWIPAYPLLWQVNMDNIPVELLALWDDLRSTRIQVRAQTILLLVISALLLLRRGRLRALQQELNSRIARPRDDSIVHTLQALLYVVLRSLAFPLLLAGVASALVYGALGAALNSIAISLFVLLFMKILYEPAGVGARHFNWGELSTADVHREMRWLIRWWLPLALATILILSTTLIPSGEAVLARYTMIALILTLIALLSGALTSGARRAGWLSDGANRIRLVVMLVLVTLVVAIAVGHVYSVDVISNGLVATLLIGICLQLVRAVLLRWVAVTRRRLRMAELIEARTEPAAAEDAVLDEQEASLGDLSEESIQLINVGLAAAAIAALFDIWSPILPAFQAFTEITLWTSTSMVEGEPVENRISLAMVFIVIFLTSLTLYAARKLPALIDLGLRSQTSVSGSARYTVSALVNYVIIGSGIVAGLSALGLQWSQLQWLVAALGVGIGFGLQEIIANFISGLIILFERPIRVGDIVSTGGNDGVVTRIRIRATTICDWDGKELLVPNKEFITGRLLNWSLSDPKTRIVVPVGIAYGSDVEQAIKILHDIVCDHPRVVEDPEPQIVFESFGDNALQLSARCFLISLENRMAVVTALNREIYRRFEDAGIVIAFPQRDIHIDSDKPLRIALEGKSTPED